jgi:cold shock CspA family protein
MSLSSLIFKCNEEEKMPEGNIKNLVEDRGFGFIEVDGKDNKDIFFHATACDDCTFDGLKQGQRVEYELEAPGSGDRGPRASRVRTA